MQIIGRDKDGYLIGFQRGLVRSTIYRGYVSGLGDFDDVGAINWTEIFSGINSNPLLIGLGQKIAGGGSGGVVPINAYGGYGSPNVYASGPGFGGAMNPMYIMMAAGLGLILLLKR